MLDNLEVQKQLGLRIREMRIERNYSIKEFAYKLDVEYSNLIRIETVRTNLRLNTIVKIANALEVPIEKLFIYH
ncbi:MAG: helix-turn-helix domain-containing protein [Alistipes sp.]|nr:helix-turn-helix domain-containing protein [Alistipes sp.]